jgi:hypothetical protein
MPKTIRNIDDDVFEEAKRVAKAKDMNLGEAVNEALVNWLSSQEDPELSIMDFEPISLSGEDGNLSENYEEKLYG